jgi:hypothetical protein
MKAYSMYENNLHVIHNLQQELTGSLGIAANNPDVSDLLTNARRVVHTACREVANWRRHGLASHEIAVKMQKAIDEVMNPLTDKVAAIRRMTPGERRVLGQPKRPAPINPGVVAHNEMMRMQALREAAVAAIDEVQKLGGMVAEAPGKYEGQLAVQLIGLDINQVSPEARAALLGSQNLCVGILRERSGRV